MERNMDCIFMKTNLMRIIVYLSLLLVVSISCQQKKAYPKLYGRWVLDSTSTRHGMTSTGGKKITLNQNGNFEYEWSDFDVSGSYKGKYTYLNTK
jgi:hypothetical protein